MTTSLGLEGIIAAQTRLSLIDGIGGKLVYRGYYANQLAQGRSFEEVAQLLWTGDLNNQRADADICRWFQEFRSLDKYMIDIIRQLPTEMDMMSVLRAAVAAMIPSINWPPSLRDAVRLVAQVPVIIAYRYAQEHRRAFTPPDASLSHVANYLYMLTGEVPTPHHVRALEAYLVLTMEHGLNASTFAARVVTSTESDMMSAAAAAIGAMKGPLHGGAPSGVMTMLDAIPAPAAAEDYLRAELQAGHRLMGFGHRVYKTMDPRSEALHTIVSELSGTDAWFHLATHVESTAVRLLEEFKPGRRLYTNVEYWAAAIMKTVGIPSELYTATFTASRMVGWTAHILEQAIGNRIMRPQSEYVGPMPVE